MTTKEPAGEPVKEPAGELLIFRYYWGNDEAPDHDTIHYLDRTDLKSCLEILDYLLSAINKNEAPEVIEKVLAEGLIKRLLDEYTK